MRTAFTLVDLSFAPFRRLPPIAGCIELGMMDALPAGWVSIGPVGAFLSGMKDNSAKSGLVSIKSSRFICVLIALPVSLPHRRHSPQ